MSRLIILFIVATLAIIASSFVAFAEDTTEFCPSSATLNTYLGATSHGFLATTEVKNKCPLPQFIAVPNQAQQTAKGKLTFGLNGEYIYTASATQEGVDIIHVDVFCFNNEGRSVPLCRQVFIAQVSRPFTLAPAQTPETTAATPAVRTCPVVYHFTAITGTTLSETLQTAVGQPECEYGKWFEVERLPNYGKLNLVASGAFTYDSPDQQTWDDFSYTLKCFNTVLCRGSVYVLSSGTAAPAGSPSSSGGSSPSSGGGGDGTTTSGIGADGSTGRAGQTCRGSCTAKSWKAVPGGAPYHWDTSTKSDSIRADGIEVGTVRASYKDGNVELVIYTKIGNLGQRFPTFEPIEFHSGETLSASDIKNRISDTSIGFCVDCMAKQGTDGQGSEVWHWTSVANRTGGLGPLHRSEHSWYQKFGGAHDRCDTYAADSSCDFAPLLTPDSTAFMRDPSRAGVWSVDIDGCDVTWRGRFSLAALRNMRKKDGVTPVWSVTQGRDVRTTLYLQAIQPSSWQQSVLGYQSDLIVKPIVLTLDPDVRVTLDSEAKKLFSVGSAFRLTRDKNSGGSGNGDYGFALDLRVFPHVPETAQTSYKADRHVSGFRWIDQKWITPDRAGCPSCTGTQAHCSSDPRAPTSSFFSTAGQAGCNTPVVALSKGPAMSKTACMASRMYIFDRAGISAPQGCANTYQNLTIRGVARGSGSSANFFGFEGGVTLQLMLDTGVYVTIHVSISRFVSMMSVDGTGVTGSTKLCRASAYWPVLDPLGTSLPTFPYFLAPSAADTEEAFMCLQGSRTFGPTTWATVMLDLDNSRKIQIEAASVEYDDPHFNERIFFISRDTSTGREGVLPTTKTEKRNDVWWSKKYPFLNFRDLSAALSKTNATEEIITSPPLAEPVGSVDYAMAFTPGAVGVSTSATLTFVARVVRADGSLGGHVTLRALMALDDKLADRDMVGVHQDKTGVEEAKASNAKTTYFVVFATGGLVIAVIAVLVIFMSVDTSKPLPSWIPNAHELRSIVLTNNILLRPFTGGSKSDEDVEAGAAAARSREIKSVDGVKIPSISSPHEL